MSAAPHPFLEELVAFATPEETKRDLLEAKVVWFERAGEVFEEDRQFEMRLAAFLEHYVCDRIAPHFGKTPARERYERAVREPDVARAAGFRSLTETRHGLFEVERLRPGEVRLSSLFGGVSRDVTERRQLVGLEEGDVLEARLIPRDGHFYFSPAYCFHPHEAAEKIREEAQRLAAQGQVDELAFIHECAQRALKVARYRQISVDKIYDFGARR